MRLSRTSPFHFILTMLALAASLLATPSAPAHARTALGGGRPLGDSQVFARLPAEPGFPESIATDGDRVYVCGPAQFGNFVPPQVLAYDLNTGALVAEYPIVGEDPTRPQAGTGIAFAKNGELYVSDLQLGVIRFDVDRPGGPQQSYAPPLPDLPTCSSVAAGTPCSPTQNDSTPLPNDLVFDKDGNAYITDSFQATIWRIPPGGGQPQIWFQSSALDAAFGPNGMRLDPKGEKAYISVTFAGPYAQGYIYTLPLVAHPAESDLRLFHTYEPGAGPDGIAFGKSGQLYVALAGTNQISVLSPDGSEVRYHGPASDPANPAQPLPWANPSAITFNDKTRSLLVTNHAIFFPNPASYFAIFDLYVDDKADHLAQPNVR